MSSTTETGHAKNLASLENLINYCSNYGATYAPTNPAFAIDNLRALHAQGKQSLQTIFKAKTVYETAVNERKALFDTVKPIATKALNAFMACGAAPATVDDARGYYNKLLGRRAGTTARAKAKASTAASSGSTGAEELPKVISVSQQSYDKQVEHFEQLISTLSGEPKYNPNEQELKLDTLTQLLNDMNTRNSAVIGAYVTLSTARIKRDEVFDAPTTGLIDTALDIKKYLKSVFGPSSAQYKQITGLQFRRM